MDDCGDKAPLVGIKTLFFFSSNKNINHSSVSAATLYDFSRVTRTSTEGSGFHIQEFKPPCPVALTPEQLNLYFTLLIFVYSQACNMRYVPFKKNLSCLLNEMFWFFFVVENEARLT